MGAGLSINLYVTSIFTPYILADFGWSDSEFALVGTTTIVVLFCMPIIGRLTDRFGVRRIAATGVLAMPLSFIAFSLYRGGIGGYAVLYALPHIFRPRTPATVSRRAVTTDERRVGEKGGCNCGHRLSAVH